MSCCAGTAPVPSTGGPFEEAVSGGEAKLLGRWGGAGGGGAAAKGLKVLAAGYRSRFGEIDPIAATDKYLSFIEVKLRTEERFALGRGGGSPEAGPPARHGGALSGGAPGGGAPAPL
ncbi:MAG: YraN family protein [Flavonifractor plautii]